MAVQLDQNGKDDLKTQFVTREGTYRLMLGEYSRPNRVGYTSNQSSPQVRVSIVALPTHLALPQSTPTPQPTAQATNLATTNGQEASGYALAAAGGDRICYNFGKELFVYAYRGVKKVLTLALSVSFLHLSHTDTLHNPGGRVSHQICGDMFIGTSGSSIESQCSANVCTVREVDTSPPPFYCAHLRRPKFSKSLLLGTPKDPHKKTLPEFY